MGLDDVLDDSEVHVAISVNEDVPETCHVSENAGKVRSDESGAE